MTQNVDLTLKLGTRGSLLARAQSQLMAGALERIHPGLRVTLHIIKTTGDQIADRPLHDVGGKGLFTRELELALIAREVDFAVHSYKDVPVTMPLVDASGLTIAAVPPREDARDVLVTHDGRPLLALPPAARIGTGSLRRRSQLLTRRSDLAILPIRGNVDTRLRKLSAGEFDAVILAMAGVRRANLFDAGRMAPIDVEHLLPAPAQGALALQCRADDRRVTDLLSRLNDPLAAACVEAERHVVRLLEGDCHSPIAAYAVVDGDRLTLRAAVAARDGNPPTLYALASGSWERPTQAAELAFAQLAQAGAGGLLHPTD